MKKRYYGLALMIVAVALVTGAFLGTRHLTAAHAATSCIANADGRGHSAAVLNPTGVFSGTLDATTCNFGIYVSSGHTATITNASIFGASLGDVVVDGTANISNSNLTESEVGIYYGYNGAGHGTATGNSISSFSDEGIYVENAGTTATLTSNTIDGTYDDTYGVYSDGAQSLTASYNTVSNNEDGFELEYDSTDTISFNRVSNASDEGIYDEYATTVTYNSNIVTNNGDVGIETYADTSVSISRNTSTSNRYGIYIESDTTDTVSNNIVANSSNIGIEAEPPSGKGYSITNNALQNNPIGIEVDSGTGSRISTNRLQIGTTGILDDGTSDTITSNLICAYTTPINTSSATTPIVSGNFANSSCSVAPK
jgi:parallel beta-helix repeat protein